jgi:hypothetical protein
MYDLDGVVGLGVREDREVGLPPVERPRPVRRREVHGNARKRLLEIPDRRQHDARPDIRPERESQLAAQSVAEIHELRPEIVELGHVTVQQVEQQLARAGQPHAAGHAVEYGQAELLLEALDGAVQRRG